MNEEKDLKTQWTEEAYQKGFKDGFCKAFDYVIENARFHQSTYESIFNMFKENK